MAGLPNSIFEISAPTYDLLTRQPYWPRQIKRLLDHVGHLAAGCRLLDLGCGPGVSTFALAESLGPEVEVVGIDLSAAMIGRARSHHAHRFGHLEQIRFERADATHLSMGDAHFDAAVAHSFLYLVPDRAGVLREVHRVLRPGARLVLMEPDPDAHLAAVVREASGHLGELLAHPFDAGRFAASMVSWRFFASFADKPDQHAMAELFAAAGFTGFRVTPTLAGLGMHCRGVRR